MSDQLTTIALILLLCATQVFWAWKCSRLLDRLMAGDYNSLVRADKYKKTPQVTARQDLDVIDDDYAATQANRANALLT